MKLDKKVKKNTRNNRVFLKNYLSESMLKTSPLTSQLIPKKVKATASVINILPGIGKKIRSVEIAIPIPQIR